MIFSSSLLLQFIPCRLSLLTCLVMRLLSISLELFLRRSDGEDSTQQCPYLIFAPQSKPSIIWYIMCALQSTLFLHRPELKNKALVEVWSHHKHHQWLEQFNEKGNTGCPQDLLTGLLLWNKMLSCLQDDFGACCLPGKTQCGSLKHKHLTSSGYICYLCGMVAWFFQIEKRFIA